MDTNKAIRNRKTVKVLGDPDNPLPVRDDLREVILEMIETAGWAPYHYACHKLHREGEMTSIVPWRFHVVGANECRKLLKWLVEQQVDSGKIAQMLATADALVQVNWLPDIGSESTLLFEPTIRNLEHIAAASSAVQNFLLSATSRGISSYWSSGGVLREKEIFQYLGINENEFPLASVFLFPTDTGDAESVEGKLNNLRGKVSDWSRWVQI